MDLPNKILPPKTEWDEPNQLQLIPPNPPPKPHEEKPTQAKLISPLNSKPKTQEENLLITLPKEIWFNCYPMYLYQGFWCINLEPTIAFQTHFEARATDIFITSLRKTGTTWLKALIFSIFDRATHPLSKSPLLSHNPHELVPQLESNVYAKCRSPCLKNDMISPRIFGTHLPYSSLPTSMKESNCKIIYICRNPLDTFISSWLFYLNYDENKTINPRMMEEYLEKFMEGKFPSGPFEDHVLGYWKQRLARPKKVFFVKYEDLKADPKGQLKLLAEFVGRPFSKEEEEEGVVDGIVELCSIQKLKEVEANKSGRVYHQIKNKWFFRKGEVGDWANYLTPSMAQKLEQIIEEKLAGSGLTFK